MLTSDQLRLAQKDIETYEKATGIMRTDASENQEVLRDQRDCIPKLELAEKEIVKFKGRTVRRGFVIGIGIPVAAGIGYLFGAI